MNKDTSPKDALHGTLMSFIAMFLLIAVGNVFGYLAFCFITWTFFEPLPDLWLQLRVNILLAAAGSIYICSKR